MSDVEQTQPEETKLATAEPTVEQESALHRWSRRKVEARDLPTEPAASTPPAEVTEPEPPPELTDTDMPPIESLTESSDVSGFFSKQVSAELRRQALRKVFHLAKFNIRDGLDDYDDDFTNFEKLGEDVMTADRRHMLEVKKRQEEEEAELAEANAVEMDENEMVAEETETVVEEPEVQAENLAENLAEDETLELDNEGEEDVV